MKEKACCPKVFVFVKGMRKVLLSEMERSCLDGWISVNKPKLSVTNQT